MTKSAAIVWFRQDLRLADNPAITQAIKDGFDIIPLYILDDINAKERKMGEASRWWLHQSLGSLNKSLNDKMVFRSGDAKEIIPALIKETGAKAVYWNRCYEPWRIKRDKEIKEALHSIDIKAESFNASLLWEPWEIKKNDGTPYKVFTPYYRKGCLGTGEPAKALPRPQNISFAAHKLDISPLGKLNLIPVIKWYDGMVGTWTPGEDGARTRLQSFLENGLKGYKELRNRPDKENISRLSPHLHFGEISPRTIWHDAQGFGISHGFETDLDCFCSELGWREFSYSLLYYNPDLSWQNLNRKFDNFLWRDGFDDELLERWQKGTTGIPLVDAGMRELWHTGWVHNRVRMVVASFLVKNLLIHWQRGEEWFWDTLVDADMASNAASWQWVAGCGADAAPYFRIFNPVTQGEKFDPDEAYIRKWIPEYGSDQYPKPVVDLKKSRDRALEAYQHIKGVVS